MTPATIVATNVARSTAYAVVSPTRSINTPPTSGPTTNAVFHIAWFSAIAAGSCSAPTRFGVIAERLASAKPLPAATNATPK
ncbi:MAG: hypothetical protein U0V73_14340 [Acidimicrobiia bacterium]